MATGTVKNFWAEKGFGFITPDGGGNDYFAASNDIATDPKTLVEGQRVEFEVSVGTKGPQAIDIKVV
ncbi:cold-shock protein [Streptomyces sp. NPDC006309]|uniref:cold-shock protein n=1 Tax=Streptomyces sp. NPDC006309 TaxID=3156749 RepID=UPI0033B42871